MSNSIQRIKFDRNSTSESAAAILPHVRLALSHCPTKMRHRFKRGMKMHWACVKLVPPKKKKKEETWPFLSQCTYCRIVSFIFPVPLADNFWQNLSCSSLDMFVRLIEYSTFKTIFAGRHTRQYQFWSKCDTSATTESTVAFLPHLIELNSTRQKCDVWTGP